MEKDTRRDYVEIGHAIVESLREGQKTIGGIAAELGTGWMTVRRCLNLLEGVGVVTKVVAKPVSIYRLNSIVSIPEDLDRKIDEILAKSGTHESKEEFVQNAIRSHLNWYSSRLEMKENKW